MSTAQTIYQNFAKSKGANGFPSSDLKEKLNELLDSKNWKDRNIAVKIINDFSLHEYISTLLTFISDRTPVSFAEKLLGGDFYQVGFIRRNAARAIGEIGEYSDEVEQTFIKALSDPYWEVRTEVAKSIRALWKRPPSEALSKALVSRLADRKFEVLVEIITTIGELFQSEDIIKELRPLYNHPNSRVKQALVDTLLGLYKKEVIKNKESTLAELNQIFIPGRYK